MNWPRVILHVDMDAFFAAIEQHDRPELRGRPVLIGHDGPRGVVAAASYEARTFGCHSAQPMAVAKRLCPKAVILPPNGPRIREVSGRVFEIFDRFAPLVEPLSVDEAFLDLTGTRRLLGDGVEVAEKIRAAVRAATGLTASVGVAPNKFLAKLASDMDKPDGLTVIAPEDIDRVLPPLKVTRLWGIGPATAARLEKWNIRTVADLRARSVDELRMVLGNETDWYLRLAHGLDDRPVTPDHAAKSIGHEQTFETDLEHPDAVRDILLEQAEQVGRRLRKHALRARTITLKIRFGDFETITRSQTLDHATDITDELWRAAREIFDRWASGSYRPVRLIGVSAGNLVAGEQQLGLFVDPGQQKQRQLDAAADAIVKRFGKTAIHRGLAAGPGKLATTKRQEDVEGNRRRADD